jgi:O-antigen/teichoic acid export membrane protein
MVDASLASLATFAIGLYAARSLSATDLGVYALFFSTFIVASGLPTQLLLIPSEAFVLRFEGTQRLSLLRQTVPAALALALLSSAGVALPIIVARTDTSAAVLIGMSITMAAAVLLSPVQDHVRRMLHISNRSWAAAATSGAQLGSIAVGIVVLRMFGAAAHLIPFGALAIANLLSLTLGLALSRRDVAGTPPMELQRRDLLKSGRWLLAAQLLPGLTGFAVGAAVIRLTSADVLGIAEAARIVSQPVLVGATGLALVLGPESMAAAQRRDRSHAQRMSALYNSIIGLGGIALIAGLGVAWRWNPMRILVPRAYEVAGVVAVTILANIFLSASRPAMSELIGSRREVDIARNETMANLVRLLPVAAAVRLQSFTPAVTLLLLGGTRFQGFRRAANRIYDRGDEDSPA